LTAAETFHVVTIFHLVFKLPKPTSKPNLINQRFDLHVADNQNGLPLTNNSLNVIFMTLKAIYF